MTNTILINRSQTTSNFTILNNAIANDASLSSTATSILIYLISKPPHWKFNANDVARRFNIGLSKVYRTMRELIHNGYAYYVRTKSKVAWFFYDTKQIHTPTEPEISNRVRFKHVQNEYEYKELTKKENIENNNIEPVKEAVKTENENVVVKNLEEDNLIYPKLKHSQLVAAKKLIKQTPLDRQQAILSILALQISKGAVNNPIGYLTALINKDKFGQLEFIEANTKTIDNQSKIKATQTTLAELRAIKKTRPVGGMNTLRAAILGIKVKTGTTEPV